jgi:hypothetical protein
LPRFQRDEIFQRGTKYSVPLECFHDLVVDLQRLNVSKAVEPSIQPDVRFVAETDIPSAAEAN